MAARFLAPSIILQSGGILAGLTALAFAPPAQGRMLLVPVTAQGAAELVPLAVGSGSLLIGPGPLPRSYVVMGDARLAKATSGHAIITLAAPPAGCGEPAA
jgi:hypothetical protein